MKKFLLVFLLFALCLNGCGSESAAPSYDFEDLSIQVPEDYINLSDEEFAADLAFVFGKDPIAVNGLREEKTTFEAYGLQLDAQRYGEFIIMANKVDAEPEEKDGIITFTYASGGYTYMVTVWETETAFWTVQAYCPTEDFSASQKDMWKILSSVTV